MLTPEHVLPERTSGTGRGRFLGSVKSHRRKDLMHSPQPESHRDRFLVGMVGTYPPTHCGIATFTAALSEAIRSDGQAVRVVALVDAESAEIASAPEVVAHLVRGSSGSMNDAAASLDDCDVVIVQHEFGIYDGEDGSDVVELVDRLRPPVVVVLHTVLSRPSAGQRTILEQLADRVDALVVQSAAARRRLLRAHDIEPHLVELIPHGALPNLSASPALVGSSDAPPTILSWGLLSPGKGIELGIEALAMLGDLEQQPRYHVLGQTHPKVSARDGERYRESLVALAESLGVVERLHLEDAYTDRNQILARVRAADIVLLPYRSREQVVSGVLAEAVASSTPVVATAFPHARELLASGAGTVVPHDDPAAIAAAIRRLCTDRIHALATIAAARRTAPTLFWDNVARAYRRLAVSVETRPAIFSQETAA